MTTTTDDTGTIERITFAGRDHWLETATGRMVPVVEGGSDIPPPTPPAPPAPAPAPPAPPAPTGGTLTQADVDAAAAAAAAAAEKTAKANFDAWLAEEKRKVDLAGMDDAARTKAEADQAKAEAEQLRADAAADRLMARIELACTAAGATVPGDIALMVRVAADADDATLAAAVAALKEKIPGAFTGVTAPPPNPAPPGGTGAQPPTGGQPAKSGLERGRELARHQRPAKPEGDPFAALRN